MGKVKNTFKIIGIIFIGLIGLIIELYIILNITFSIQLNNKLAELKAKGKPMTIAEIIPPAVPDKENAATFYNKAFVLMTSGEGGKPYIPNKGDGIENKAIKTITDVRSFSDISQWTDEQRREIPKLIYSREIREIYSVLEQGSQKPKCNFNLEYEKGIDMVLPQLQQMRSSIRLLCVKALLEATTANSGEVFETLLGGLKISNHLRDEPVLISQLVRIACDGMIIECIKNISDSKSISVEKSKLIMDELSIHKDIEPFVKCMDGQRIIFGGILGKLTLGKISWKELADMITVKAALGDPKGWKYPLNVRLLCYCLTSPIYRPMFKKDYTCYLTLLSKIQDSYSSPYYQIVLDVENNPIEKQIPIYCISTRMLLAAIDRVREIAARHQADIDICRTGLALRIYRVKNGDYPEKLESLVPEFLEEIPVDPFSGENLKYFRYERGFKVYSIGPNMQDDFGAKRTYEEGSPASENYDIVWEFGA